MSTRDLSPLDRGIYLQEFYSDLRRAGGLAEAIRGSMRSLGLANVEVSDSSPQLTGAEVRTVGTGYVAVSLGKAKRWFSLAFLAGSGRVCASGGTEFLEDAIRSIYVWQGGLTPLRRLVEQFSFLEVEPVALAFEEGDPVAKRWDLLLHDDELVEIRPLLRAAWSVDRIRQMSPSVTHLTLLRLSPTVERSAVEVRVQMIADGSYRIDFSPAERIFVETTIAQAIGRVVDSLG